MPFRKEVKNNSDRVESPESVCSKEKEFAPKESNPFLFRVNPYLGRSQKQF